MDKRRRFTLMFVAGCAVVAIAACIATTLGMLRLIYWYLGNCGASTACSAASWAIDYWWALFVPASLIAALVLRRVHDRCYVRISAG